MNDAVKTTSFPVYGRYVSAWHAVIPDAHFNHVGPLHAVKLQYSRAGQTTAKKAKRGVKTLLVKEAACGSTYDSTTVSQNAFPLEHPEACSKCVKIVTDYQEVSDE